MSATPRHISRTVAIDEPSRSRRPLLALTYSLSTSAQWSPVRQARPRAARRSRASNCASVPPEDDSSSLRRTSIRVASSTIGDTSTSSIASLPAATWMARRYRCHAGPRRRTQPPNPELDEQKSSKTSSRGNKTMGFNLRRGSSGRHCEAAAAVRTRSGAGPLGHGDLLGPLLLMPTHSATSSTRESARGRDSGAFPADNEPRAAPVRAE